MQPEPLVKRVPHDPNAVDISALKRASELATWRRINPALENWRRKKELGNG